MRKFLICFTACLVITGCATEGQYQSKLALLVSKPTGTLIAQWGKPTGQYTDGSGEEVIAYIKTRDIIVSGNPSYAITGSYGATSIQTPSLGIESGEIHLSCMTKFIVRSGLIQSYTFKGNDCKYNYWSDH